MKKLNLIQSILERLRYPKQSVSPSRGGGFELTEQEVMAALSGPARIAFANLRSAVGITGHPGYVWARRNDVDLLLSETTVSVGIEVDMVAAQQAMVALDKLFFDYIDDPHKLIDKGSDLIRRYFEEDRTSD